MRGIVLFIPISCVDMAYLGFSGSACPTSLSPVAGMEKVTRGARVGRRDPTEAVRVNSICSPEQRPRGCARNVDLGLTPLAMCRAATVPGPPRLTQVPPSRAQRVGRRGLPAQLLCANQDEIIDKAALLAVGQMTVGGRVCSGTTCGCGNPPAAAPARCHPPGKDPRGTPSGRKKIDCNT